MCPLFVTLNYYQQALTIFQQQQARKEQGTILTNIAAVYRNLGQYQKSLEFYQQALAIVRNDELKRREKEGRILFDTPTLKSMGFSGLLTVS